jgi:hypothetical protein
MEGQCKVVLKEMECEGVKWSYQAQDSVLWPVVMNNVITFGLHKELGIS